MEEPPPHFVEVYIYEVKPDKTEQFEALLERVGRHHRQGDFSAVRQGEPAISLTRCLVTMPKIILGERLC